MLPHQKITPREREIIDCLSNGQTSSEIATSLFISIETVKSHRSNLMKKFDARNAFQLAIKITESNIGSKERELVQSSESYQLAIC